MLPHDGMEECKGAFERRSPLLESVFRDGEGGEGGFNELWEDVEFAHLHVREFRMSSSNIYLIKVLEKKHKTCLNV